MEDAVKTKHNGGDTADVSIETRTDISGVIGMNTTGFKEGNSTMM